MNQSNLQASISRYPRKRNSYDILKSSYSVRNGKKSLPQVFIDLNNHTKKIKLTIDDKGNKHKDNSHSQVSHFNEGRKTKAKPKKDTLVLKNIYNTEVLRRQDQNKNILNQYRDQMELLRLDNEKLREQNQKLKIREKHLNRKISEEQLERREEQLQHRQFRIKLEARLDEYALKIKKLYEQLIKAKKGKKSTQGSHQRQNYIEAVIIPSQGSECNRNRAKGQLYSYRNYQPAYDHYEGEIVADKYKRMTSPSSHSRGNSRGKQYTGNITKWHQEQKQNIKKYQQRGEDAYYRAQKIKAAKKSANSESQEYD